MSNENSELIAKYLTKQECNLLSVIATDLLTGAHLLGKRKDVEGYRPFLKEVLWMLVCVNKGTELNDRQRAMLIQMATNFHDGAEDMAEQLGIDTWKVREAIDGKKGMNEMQCAVSFLKYIYRNDFHDMARISTAEAEGNKEIIRRYLSGLHRYAQRLLDRLK